MKSLMLARSNIKKSISSTVILIILVTIATMMLYLGSAVIFRLGGFIDNKNNDLNGADFYVMTDCADEAEDKVIFEKIGGVKDSELNQSLLISGVKMQASEKEEKAQTVTTIFLNADESHEISKLKIIDEGTEKKQNSIIVPNYLKFAYGYKTGDRLLIKSGVNEYEFEIYGFAEDIMLANPVNALYLRCFIYSDLFEQMQMKEQATCQKVFYKVKLTAGNSSKDFDDMFVKYASNDEAITNKDVLSLNCESMKIGLTATISIFMVMLILFSVIILVVTMVIIRFSIVTHIEENIKNLGSMIAIGYKSKEIKASLILQFTGIAAIGWLLGYILSYPAGIIINQLVSSSTGLEWNNEFCLTAFIVSIVAVLGMVALITSRTASKLKKVTPVTALRSGIETHNFKKNYLRFDKSVFPMNSTVGLKAMLHNGKQNLVMAVISLLISFTLVFSLMAYYNFVVEDKAFLQLIGIEKSSIQVKCSEEDYESVYDQIAAIDGVNHTVQYTSLNMRLSHGEKECSNLVNICDDFSKLTIKTVIDGRYPLHANEIVLSSVVSKRLGAGIGKVVTIEGQNGSVEYIVVGICQHICYLGESAMLTEEGIQELMPDFEPRMLNIYLDDQVETNEMLNTLQEKFSGQNVEFVNMDEYFDGMLTTMNQAIVLIAAIFVAITLGIIILTMYYLVKVKLIKEKQNIGISKSLGFTTPQLIRQIITSFCPVIAIGALIGGVLAMFLVSPLTTLMLSMSGIKNANFLIPPSILLVSFLAISLTAVITTTLSAIRIRHITPRDLVA